MCTAMACSDDQSGSLPLRRKARERKIARLPVSATWQRLGIVRFVSRRTEEAGYRWVMGGIAWRMAVAKAAAGLDGKVSRTGSCTA